MYEPPFKAQLEIYANILKVIKLCFVIISQESTLLNLTWLMLLT